MRDPGHLSAPFGRGIVRFGVATFAVAALLISVATGSYAQTAAAPAPVDGVTGAGTLGAAGAAGATTGSAGAGAAAVWA